MTEHLDWDQLLISFIRLSHKKTNNIEFEKRYNFEFSGLTNSITQQQQQQQQKDHQPKSSCTP